MEKPDWIKAKLKFNKKYISVRNLLRQNGLNTVCQSAMCPNIGECFGRGTATFMILGDICTRNCTFCNIKNHTPKPVEKHEPRRIAEAVKILGLSYVVITSVTRDDLPDGGSEFWAETIRTAKKLNPGVTIEALIPDFRRGTKALDPIIKEKPEVISHNLETVRRLTPVVRCHSTYDQSLELLKYVASSGIVAKSGIMAGFGETDDEVMETMDDLLTAGVRVFIIGQYLQPSEKHIKVEKYISPDTFRMYREAGLKKGFMYVESGPQVRSSYHAERHVNVNIACQ